MIEFPTFFFSRRTGNYDFYGFGILFCFINQQASVFLSIFPEISSKSWGSLGTKRKIDLYFADGFFCQMPMKFAKEKRDRMCGDHPYLCKISPRKLPDDTVFENRSKMIILLHCALRAKKRLWKMGDFVGFCPLYSECRIKVLIICYWVQNFR